MSNAKEDEIVKRLDLIIALMLESKPETPCSVKDQILRLHRLGLAPAEIGRMLGKPTNQITATLPRRSERA